MQIFSGQKVAVGCITGNYAVLTYLDAMMPIFDTTSTSRIASIEYLVEFGAQLYITNDGWSPIGFYEEKQSNLSCGGISLNCTN